MLVIKEEKFDFEAFRQETLKKFRHKKAGATAEKLFKPLFKQFIEEVLQAEMDSHVVKSKGVMAIVAR